MNTLTKIFGVLAVIPLLISGCAALPVQAETDEQSVLQGTIFREMLGKSVTDKAVVNFITSNNCSIAQQFQLCKEIGMALWVDSNQRVEIIYLYLNNEAGFTPYKGELPFGLKFYDTMGAVEYKLKRQGVGKDGLPDSGWTPDHMYYRAVYKQAGMTVIYNSPFVDEDATIQAVLITK